MCANVGTVATFLSTVTLYFIFILSYVVSLLEVIMCENRGIFRKNQALYTFKCFFFLPHFFKKEYLFGAGTVLEVNVYVVQLHATENGIRPLPVRGSYSPWIYLSLSQTLGSFQRTVFVGEYGLFRNVFTTYIF